MSVSGLFFVIGREDEPPNLICLSALRPQISLSDSRSGLARDPPPLRHLWWIICEPAPTVLL